MRRSQRVVIECSLATLSLLVIIAVAVLPWRDVRPQSPFVSGTHLSQMGLPALMLGLVAFALLAPLMGLLLDRGDWPARLITVSGVGIVVLVLLVQHSAATSALIASSLQIHAGNALAIVAGVLIALVGALCLLQRTRSSGRGTLVRT